MPTIFLDESHNTGAALLDPAQPVFTLASVDYNPDECEELLRLVSSAQASEAKFRTLQKNSTGRQKLIDFFGSPIHSENRAKTTIVFKRFNVVTQIVDLIDETLMRKDGIDIYKNGYNIFLANRHWYSMPLCGEQRFNDFLAFFVDMVRNQTDESKIKFFNTARDLYNNCKDEDYKSLLATYIYAQRFIDNILNGIDKNYLDPSIFSLFSHLTTWGKQLGKPFVVIHDKSKSIMASHATFSKMMDSTIPPAVIGYDQRKFEFPLTVTELRLADSKQYPALQVADLIAGATRYYYSALARNVDDQFAIQLEEVGIRRFVFSVIGPMNMEHFQPEISETDDINPADYMMRVCRP